MPDATLTTTTPASGTTTRPVPPSWATVAPLLARWQIALAPHRDGSWDVLATFPGANLPVHEAWRVPFARLPEAIAAVAAQCEAAAKEKR
jgi:hypothetical protein